jgi:hypothetical protein
MFKTVSYVLLSLLLCPQAWAQSAGSLVGRVTDETGGVLPGVTVDFHSGGKELTAVTNETGDYYLRGFNLDHGSDFAATIAGIPVNLPTQAHFHGYADTNLLIPELVSGVQFKKGPYYAEDGDFSAAGSVNVNYVNSLDQPMVSVSGGGQGWGRLLGAVSPRRHRHAARRVRGGTQRRPVGIA